MTKATIKDGVYEYGEAKFGVDETSVKTTVDMVSRQPRPTHEKILLAHGVDVEDRSDEAVRVLAQSFVQNDWYELIKGEIPMATKKNHEARVKKYAKAKGSDKEKAEKRERTRKSFTLTRDKAKLAKLDEVKSAQQQLIIKALKSENGKAWDTASLTKKVESFGKLETKQDPIKVVSFYVVQYRKSGFLVDA